MAETIGYLGLGAMGAPMVRNLLAAGHPVAVYDPEPERVAALAAEGARPAGNPAAVAREAELILVCVTSGQAMEAAVTGPEGIVAGCREGQVVVDMTTNSPTICRRVAEALAPHGVALVDAPISGGPPRAAEATLSIMAGGPAAAFARCLPVLRRLGAQINHIGGHVGAGAQAKLVNQVIYGLNLLAVAEGYALAEKAGLDLEALTRALQGGLAHSDVLDIKAPKVMQRDFSPVGPVWMLKKDLGYVAEAMASLGVRLPAVEHLRELIATLSGQGHDDLDQLAILHLYEQWAGIDR